MLIKSLLFWNHKIRKLILPKLKEQFVYIGSKDNAKKEITVNICMFCKKKKFLLANTFYKKEYVRKEMNVSIDISILRKASSQKNAHTMREVSVDKELNV